MTVVLCILGGLLGLMALFLLIPARLRVRYAGRLELWAGVGPVTLRLLPQKPPKPKRKPARPPVKLVTPASKAPKTPKAPAKPSILAGMKPHLTLEAILAYIRLARDALGPMMKTVRIRQLRLRAVVADADPAKAALAYGGAAAAVSALLPALEGIVNWRRSEIGVDVDFSGNASLTIDATVSILPIVVLVASLRAFFRYLDTNKKLDAQCAAKAATPPHPGDAPSSPVKQKG